MHSSWSAGVVMRQNRKHPRIFDQIPVQLSKYRGAEYFALVLTRQISRGGCMIKGRHEMAPGSILDITFFLGGRCVSVTSMVIYAVECDGENLTGLRFLSMAPRDLAALEEYIGRKIQFSDDEGSGRLIRERERSAKR